MPNASKQSWFRITTDKKHLVFCIEYSGQSGNWNEYQGEKQYDDGQWHHYVCVHNSGSTYVYLDGEKVAEALNKPLKQIDSSPYFIGARLT